MNWNQNQTKTKLPVFFCLLIDLPEQDNTDCEVLSNGTLDNCYWCKNPGQYLFSNLTDGHGSAGHIICIILWIATLIMGIFGTFANGLVISVLRKRKKQTSFDILLYVLAGFDLMNSLSTLVCTTGIIFFVEHWDRGLFNLTYYYFAILVFFFGKSGSSYMTVLITVERYLIISDPIKSRDWFTSKRTKIMTIALILLAIIFNAPRYTSILIEPNIHGQNVPSLRDYEYLIVSTSLEDFWYANIGSARYIDCLAPFPLLVIFNVLLFVKISKFMKMRKQLSSKQKSDIRAAKMFVPVVVVLFLCNVLPIACCLVIRVYLTVHRELFFGMLLSVAVNSAANLPIYYARGESFKKEIRDCLPEWLRERLSVQNEKDLELTGTAGETTGTTYHIEQARDSFVPVPLYSPKV